MFGGIDRDLNRHRRPFSQFRLDVDISAVLVDNVMADHQPQAGPLCIFGGEEGVEQFLQILFRDSVARIGHRDLKVALSLRVLMKRRGCRDLA